MFLHTFGSKSITVKYLSILLLSTSLLFVGCQDLDDTEDLATLLVGTYVGDAQDNVTSAKNVKIIVTRLDNTTIQIAPAEDNLITPNLEVKLVIENEIITHVSSELGITFRAEPGKRKIPIKFSTSTPIQTFEGELE